MIVKLLQESLVQVAAGEKLQVVKASVENADAGKGA